MQAIEWYSRPIVSGQRDRSRHRRNKGYGEAHTNWRAQIEKQVRTRKECEALRGTHILEGPGKTSQDMEIM